MSDPTAPPPDPAPYAVPPPDYVPPPSPSLTSLDRDYRTWGMLCHLSALLGLVVPSFGALVGPLIIWLLKRNDSPGIDREGKESLNFQLSIFIYSWALGLLGALTIVILVGFLFLGLAILVGVLGMILAIIGAIKVSNGETWRYPLTIRFLN